MLNAFAKDVAITRKVYINKMGLSDVLYDEDDVLTLTFGIYTSQTDPCCLLWSETADVTVKMNASGGLYFDHLLSSVTPFGGAILFNKEYWLQINRAALLTAGNCCLLHRRHSMRYTQKPQRL